jgi:hypothetical protein
MPANGRWDLTCRLEGQQIKFVFLPPEILKLLNKIKGSLIKVIII